MTTPVGAPDGAEDVNLIEARLRKAITTEAAYPGGLAGERSALRRRGLRTSLGDLVAMTGEGRGTLPRVIARNVRDRYRFRRAPTSAPPMRSARATWPSSFESDVELMTVHASPTRLEGPGARSVARLLRPARKLLLRMLSPTLDAQATFNVAALSAIEQLGDRRATEVTYFGTPATAAPAPPRALRATNAAVSGDGATLQQRVDNVGFWWHTIDLGDGVVTPGAKGGGGDYMERELAKLELPDLAGRTVLDIGAWDGFYSFKAESLGASRVVALDHFAWEQEHFGAGAGFDIAHEALGSAVEKCHRDFSHDDLSDLGAFDVVFFLGVLYHLENPLGAMRRVRELTRGVAIIETEAIAVSGYEDKAIAEFFPGNELNDDATNWWSPNLAAVHGLCRAAGFSRARTIVGPPSAISTGTVTRYRAVVHAIV